MKCTWILPEAEGIFRFLCLLCRHVFDHSGVASTNWMSSRITLLLLVPSNFGPSHHLFNDPLIKTSGLSPYSSCHILCLPYDVVFRNASIDPKIRMVTMASMYRVFSLPIVCSIKTSGWSQWLFSLPMVHALDDPGVAANCPRVSAELTILTCMFGCQKSI
jgi:hypothetical protein